MNATAAISVASNRRIWRARTWLESRIRAEQVLIVGASLDAANELARNVAKEKGGAFGWHRLSFPQLAAVVAAPVLATRGLVPLSRLGTEAIVARLIHRLREEGGLSHYHAVADTPGFPRAIARVIAELRLARLAPEAVGSVAPDLMRMITAYEAELAESGLTDWPGVLMLATEAANGRNLHGLIGLPTLLLDVPIAGEAELAFVSALAAAAPEMLATVPAADLPTLGRVRDRLGLKIEDLDQAHSEIDTAGALGTGTLARLQRHLFNEHVESPPAKADNNIEVFSAPGEGRECVEIARRVLALARGGIPFDRIAILLRSPSTALTSRRH
jgi:ATP-dependent helicase/nuclease subunit B